MVIIEEIISTIVVRELPEDMTEREFSGLFVFASGFEYSALKVCDEDELLGASMSNSYQVGVSPIMDNQVSSNILSNETIKNKKKIIVGLAKFKTRLEAVEAKDRLNEFKLEGKHLLISELANKNLNRRDLALNPSYYSSSGHFSHRASRDFGASFEIPVPSYPISQLDTSIDDIISNSGKGTAIKPPTNEFIPDFLSDGLSGLALSSSPPTDEYMQAKMNNNIHGLMSLSSGVKYLAGTGSSVTIIPSKKVYRHPIGENPPCNTLYVGNLPMNSSEDELRQLFANCPGYKRLSFRTKSNGPMCFVEFEDVSYATLAMNELYGTMLTTSTKGGIRLSYSKNPLGVRPSPPTPLSNHNSPQMAANANANMFINNTNMPNLINCNFFYDDVIARSN